MKTFLTLLIIAVSATAHAQGTVQWGNNTLTRILLAIGSNEPRNATAADGLSFGLYYGPANTAPENLVLAPNLAMIGITPGVLTGAETVLALPAPEPGQVITVQVRAFDSTPGNLWAGPLARQVVLGASQSVGAQIWTTDPASRTFTLVPEPSVWGLTALGAILCFARRRFRPCHQPEETSIGSEKP